MTERQPTPPKRATEREQEYMRRIGRYKAEIHEAALADHLRLGLRERLERALAFTLEGPYFVGPSATDDNPGEFYDRARKLGLYRAG